VSYILKSFSGKDKPDNQVQAGQDDLESAPLVPDELDFDDEQKKKDAFRESDIQLARVLEDLISLLIDRDFIRFTDFPEPAQKRLIERQGLRINNSKLNLLDDDHLN
jgi:hypothetical protein